MSTYRTRDEIEREIGVRAPGYAGIYFDTESGVLNMYLTDPSMKDAAIAAACDLYGPRAISPQRFQILAPEFTWDQLNDWYQSIYSAAGAVKGICRSGKDVLAKTLAYEVATQRGANEILQAALALGIPSGAIRVDAPPPLLAEEWQTQIYRKVNAGLDLMLKFEPTMAQGSANKMTIIVTNNTDTVREFQHNPSAIGFAVFGSDGVAVWTSFNPCAAMPVTLWLRNIEPGESITIEGVWPEFEGLDSDGALIPIGQYFVRATTERGSSTRWVWSSDPQPLVMTEPLPPADTQVFY